MKALSKIFLPLIVLLGLAGCGGGGGGSNGNTGGAFTGGTYSLTIVAGSTALAQNSSTPITVTVKNPDGTVASNGTTVSLSVTPAGAGTVSAGTGAGAGTATATTAGGSAAFTFASGAQGGAAHVTASVQNTNGTASSASVDINVSSVANPLIKLTASTTTLPLNPYGPLAMTSPFPSNYLGSPYISEITIEWRHANGTLVNGTLKVNAAITPVTVAGFSTLDDPTTIWTGQTTTPPTVSGNEFLTILGSGPVSVTAGIGTIFVHADNVPGTAVLNVTGVDPDTQQPISNQIAITIAGAATPKLPGAVTVGQTGGGVYVSGANGAQSKVVSAQVLDGNGSLVADPTDGKGNSWDNVQFQIAGPAGTDATLSAITASGATQSGSSVVTNTHNGIANVTFRAGSQQGPVQVRAIVDRGDNNVDNQIQDPITATATVIVSDGKLYSLTLTSPGVNAPSIIINRVSSLATLVNQGSGNSLIPPDPNATYSFTVSAIGTDRQGNPPSPGTTVNFGSIDTPQSNFVFNISGGQGDPQEGGKTFSALDGHFVTAGGGAGPGDTVVVFGKQIHGVPAGNDDLESAVKVASVVSETQLNVATAFNFNDTTGATVNNGPVLPYIVGRQTVGNISTPKATDSIGVVSTTLNYPVSQLGRAAAVWAQGSGVDTVNGSVRTVTDAAIMVFPGVAPAKIVISPNPIPGNLTTSVSVCISDALGSPLAGVGFGFAFTNLGIGSGSVDGVSGSGTAANITDSSGCIVTSVKTSGIAASGSGSAGPTLTFSAGNASASAPITASGGLILLANPSACGGTGCTVTLTLLNSNGTPVSGVQLTGACTGDSSIGLVSGPGVTDSSGSTTASITANLNGINAAKSGSCTFTTATGSPTATVNLQGVDVCKLGLSPVPSGCAVATSSIALTATSTGPTPASFTNPSGLSCSAAAGTSQNCTGSVAGGTYTLTAASCGTTVCSWSGNCTGVGNTATLIVPAATTPGLTCKLTVN